MGKQRFITEVWDYRLSKAQPIIYCGLPVSEASEKAVKEDPSLLTNWVACIYDKGEKSSPLECHNTGLKFTEQKDDKNWQEGHDTCYKFFRTARDKYSLPNIESLKPAVAEIRRMDKGRQRATDAYNAEIIKFNDEQAAAGETS